MSVFPGTVQKKAGLFVLPVNAYADFPDQRNRCKQSADTLYPRGGLSCSALLDPRARSRCSCSGARSASKCLRAPHFISFVSSHSDYYKTRTERIESQKQRYTIKRFALPPHLTPARQLTAKFVNKLFTSQHFGQSKIWFLLPLSSTSGQVRSLRTTVKSFLGFPAHGGPCRRTARFLRRYFLPVSTTLILHPAILYTTASKNFLYYDLE